MRTIIVIGYPDFGSSDPKLIYLGSDGEDAAAALAAVEPGTIKRAIKIVNPMGIPMPLDGSTHHRVLAEAQERAEKYEKQAREEKRQRDVAAAEKKYQEAHARAIGTKAKAEPLTPTSEFEKQLAVDLAGLPLNERILKEAEARAKRFEQEQSAKRAQAQLAEAEKDLEKAHVELHGAKPAAVPAAELPSKKRK